MRQLTFSTSLAVLSCLVCFSMISAQPRFEIPLTVTDMQDSLTLYFGILPDAHFCSDPADTINGHGEGCLPPPPPAGFFDARFTCPRSNCDPSCFGQGLPCDFRPFTSAAQKDTFRVSFQLGPVIVMNACWPAGLSAYFTELTICGTNALTHTCVAEPFYGPCWIISGGLVVTTVEESAGKGFPHRFVLSQNYPNPFNPSTTIKFAVPKTDHVTLKVYDLLGREAATLANEQLAPGTYERKFNAEGLTSGVYFYRLSTGGFVRTKKLLLLR